MDFLKKMIVEKGEVLGKDILKVDMFLNHQIDVNLLNKIGEEFKKKFEGEEITKIVTVESSGIAIACITAQYFSVPVVLQKSESRITNDDAYTSEVYSFTKEKTYTIRVCKKYINKNDKLLIIDDFLANGKAILGLMDIASQAQAKVCGVGVVIEKGFQPGGKILRSNGVRVESLAIIGTIENGKVF